MDMKEGSDKSSESKKSDNKKTSKDFDLANQTLVTPAIPVIDAAKDFFKMEASGGIVLVIASMLALIVANTPLYETYDYILNEVYFHIGINSYSGAKYDFDKSILHWINDGLMAVFFFLIGP